MNRVGTLCLGFILVGAAAPAAAQQAPGPAKPAASRPQTQPQAQPQQPQPQRKASASQPVSRGMFLGSMDAEFRKMDADKNGTVTRAEIVDFERAISILKTRTANRALFAKLDLDRNGQVSQAEFARLASAPPAPNPAPTLQRFDLNKDQAVSLVEYRTGTLANFDRMDSDKDGFVSPAEMAAAGVRK